MGRQPPACGELQAASTGGQHALHALSNYLTILPVGSTPCSMSALSTPGVASSACSTRALSGAASSAVAAAGAPPGAPPGGEGSSRPSCKVVR